MTTSDARSVNARDSQGRTLFQWTNLPSGLSHSQVEDPVAGERMVWTSSFPVVKVLHNATAVPGRRSCWEVEREVLKRDEAQMGLSAFGCLAADHPMMSGPCAAPSMAEPRSRPAEPVPQPDFPACAKFLGSMPSEKLTGEAVDLGEQPIAGLEAHGCRVVSSSPEGDSLHEVWLAGAGPGLTVTARSVREGALPWGERMKETTELVRWSGSEPDVALFQPPRGYATKVLGVTEVPCESLRRPAAGVQ